jgi:hypothetical protein
MSIYDNTSFYVYAYLREDSTPYYIGKGSGKRAWSTNRTINLPADKSRIVMLAENLSEPQAFELEKQKIAEYGRINTGTGILRNMTDGGEGSSGRIHSEETKMKLRDANLGKKHSTESIEKIRRGNTGKKRTASMKRRYSESTRNRSQDHWDKINATKCKPIEIGGIQYPSTKNAAEVLNKNPCTIREWLKNGKASYL